jgi:hypothetical protein
MSEKSTLSKTFNNQFFSFWDDIIMIFPENLDLVSSRKAFETIKRANPTLIIKIWYKSVYLTYKTEIDMGDIDFFFNKDYSSDLENVSGSKEVMRIIDTMREPIRTMDSVNKEHTAKYIQIMSKLSEVYNTK